jgi:hypothetical protein
MSEPKRWLEEGAPRDVEQLFRAAQSEQPDVASLARTLTALGVGLATASVAPAAGAATAKLASPLTGGLLVKWGAVGVTLGALAAGAATITRDAPPAARAPNSAHGAAPSVGARAPAPASDPSGSPREAPDAPAPFAVEAGPFSSARAPVTVPPAARTPVKPGPALGAPRRVAPAAAAAAATPLDAETLADEVKSVERARAALAAGRAAESLSRLDDYERRFPEQRFGPEALYLRMEALVSLGRTAHARSAATRLLAQYPNTPQSARALAMLSKNP